jgi:hypothetical protein
MESFRIHWSFYIRKSPAERDVNVYLVILDTGSFTERGPLRIICYFHTRKLRSWFCTERAGESSDNK